MPNTRRAISFNSRDQQTCLFLAKTPATAELLQRVSVMFADVDAYRDERRVRERMQVLRDAGLVRSWPTGDRKIYYKLTPDGFRLAKGESSQLPPRPFFNPTPPLELNHMLTLAEVIVHTHAMAHQQSVDIVGFRGENEMVLKASSHETSPDAVFQFQHSGAMFNHCFEIDNATESLNSRAENSIKNKLLAYEAYYDFAMRAWKQNGRQGKRPRLRVVFLTPTMPRAYAILRLAAALANNNDRLLCYATTQSEFLSNSNPLTQPIFNDHNGDWQALIDLHPSSRFLRSPVRIDEKFVDTTFVN